jgi:two-component system, OmpR family, sensor histidine kinase SenX3
MSAALDAERLAVLVHEVRSPVAALSAIAETIADPQLDVSARSELVRLAISAGESVQRIVTDVAVASIRFEQIAPGSLVRDAAAAALLRGVRIEVDIAAELPLIQGDPQRLRQALDNLIANAVVHSGSDGAVVIRGIADESLRISVSDVGVGIPPEEQERIFDIGARVGGDAGGSGIGLALTRAIVEGHGGVLAVASTPGEGASFTIALPLRDR